MTTAIKKDLINKDDVNKGIDITKRIKIDKSSRFTKPKSRPNKSSVFDGLLSLEEASGYWDLHPTTIRKAIQRGNFALIDEVYKFGKTWIITADAMNRVYGEPKVKFETKKRLIETSCIEE